MGCNLYIVPLDEILDDIRTVYQNLKRSLSGAGVDSSDGFETLESNGSRLMEVVQ